MSTPVSTKLAPTTVVDPRIRRKLYHIYLINIWLSLFPAAFLLYWFFFPGDDSFLFQNLWLPRTVPIWLIFILTPFYASIIYIVTVVWCAFLTKIHIKWLNLRQKPMEGVFYRDPKDRDYLYWNKRNFARLFLFWLLHSTPFTFMKEYFSYKFFGMKIGENAVLNHIWLSPEFVEIGDNVKIGQGACVYSFMFEKDKFLVAKIVIENNVSIGPQSVIFPGTHIKNNAIVDAGSFTHPFSILEQDSLYKGTPVEKISIKHNNKNENQ